MSFFSHRVLKSTSDFSLKAFPQGRLISSNLHRLNKSNTYTTMTNPVQSSAAAAATLADHDVSHFSDNVKVFDTIAQFRTWRRQLFREGKTLGFVPTMGALHEGHLDLVREAARHTDHVAVSIFVNPAQFAPHEDLGRYPRTLPTDVAALAALGPAISPAVLVPTVQEMYPSGISLEVSQQKGAFVAVQGMSHQLEGLTRPHFFRGVATVCTKLFNITQPDAVFFGQKDIQQCVVIRTLLRDLQFPTNMHIVRTTREHDGLAMSSRNRYLSPDQRTVAPTLFRALSLAQSIILNGSTVTHDQIIGPARELIENAASEVASKQLGWDVKLDYLSAADPETLEEVTVVDGRELNGGRGIILSGAYWVGSTRLIDNILVEVKL